MITDNMKALFQFIEYLHSNADSFRKYEEEVNGLRLLYRERSELKPRENYKDKIRCDEIEKEADARIKVIQGNITRPIIKKALETNVCYYNNQVFCYSWKGIEDDLYQLITENFVIGEIPEILKHLNQYVEFRETVKTYYNDVFEDLDECIPEILKYFKEPEPEPEHTDKTKSSHFPSLDYTKISTPETEKLTTPQIALIHIYKNIKITRDNADEIIKKYGYTAKRSGENLYQNFSWYNSRANRKGRPTLYTPQKLKNKIKLFESIVKHLPSNKKQKAKDEIDILRSYLEDEDY